MNKDMNKKKSGCCHACNTHRQLACSYSNFCKNETISIKNFNFKQSEKPEISAITLQQSSRPGFSNIFDLNKFRKFANLSKNNTNTIFPKPKQLQVKDRSKEKYHLASRNENYLQERPLTGCKSKHSTRVNSFNSNDPLHRFKLKQAIRSIAKGMVKDK